MTSESQGEFWHLWPGAGPGGEKPTAPSTPQPCRGEVLAASRMGSFVSPALLIARVAQCRSGTTATVTK